MPEVNQTQSDGKFRTLAKRIISFEKWSFSFSSVVKIITVTFALAGAWFGLQSSLQSNNTLLQKLVAGQTVHTQQLDTLAVDVKAIHTAQEVQFKELSNLTPYRYYTVKRGDTLWIISDRLNVDFQVLSDMNNVADPDRLQVGMVIKYPKNTRPAQSVGPQPQALTPETPTVTP